MPFDVPSSLMIVSVGERSRGLLQSPDLPHQAINTAPVPENLLSTSKWDLSLDLGSYHLQSALLHRGHDTANTGLLTQGEDLAPTNSRQMSRPRIYSDCWRCRQHYLGFLHSHPAYLQCLATAAQYSEENWGVKCLRDRFVVGCTSVVMFAANSYTTVRVCRVSCVSSTTCALRTPQT